MGAMEFRPGDATQALQRPRDRVSVSNVCNFCRRRKVRCDKKHPCSTCTKYNNPICEYAAEPPSRRISKTDRQSYGETILRLDAYPSKKPKPLPTSNSSSTDKTSPDLPAGFNTKVHSELEYLKSKIAELEESVEGSVSHNPAPADCSPDSLWSLVTLDNLLTVMGHNPYLSTSQYFSFHNSYVPYIALGLSTARYYHPLSWVSLIKADSALSPIFSYKKSKGFHKKVTKDPSLLPGDPADPSDHVFRRKLDEFVNGDAPLIEQYTGENKQEIRDRKEALVRLNDKAKAVGLTVFDGDLELASNPIEKALMLLPSRKIIWLLIDRFFARVYPFFPFVDQETLEAHVTSILGSDSREPVKLDKLFITKKMDILHLGIILVALRFSYLTLFTNHKRVNEANLTSQDPSQEAQDLKLLLNNPIHTEVFSVAQQCLSQFGYLRYSNLSTLQLSLYLKLYDSFAPENGEGADDINTHGYTAKLIDTAMTLGFHREPNNFRSKVRDDKTNHLCRKIWWYLVILDVKGGLTNGRPLLIQRYQFDANMPTFVPGVQNVRDSSIEQGVVDSFATFEGFYEKLVRVMPLIADVRSPVRMSDLCEGLNELELVVETQINDIETLGLEKCNLPYLELQKGNKLKIGFQSVFFLSSIYLHLFNYYESMGELDVSYYYLKKLMIISIHTAMPFYDFFNEKGLDFFLNTTDIAITPSFLTLLHKATIILHLVSVRARSSAFLLEYSKDYMENMVNNPEYARRFALLTETHELCERCFSNFLKSMRHFSMRYYYSWRYCKAQERLAIMRTTTDFYLKFNKGKETELSLTIPMLEDLNGILRDSLLKVKDNAKKHRYNVEASTPRYTDSHPVSNAASVPSSVASYGDEQTSDEMWRQMLSMRPEMNMSAVYSEMPPLNSGVNYLRSEPSSEPFFNVDVDVAGADFFELLFDDIPTDGF